MQDQSSARIPRDRVEGVHPARDRSADPDRVHLPAPTGPAASVARLRPADLAHLQRAAGNAAVSAYVAQRQAGLEPAGPSEAGTPGTASAPPRRTLRAWSKGPDVAEAQARLNTTPAAPGLATDGIYGPLTVAAVREFQAANGLVVDGITGPRTWTALEAASPAVPGSGPGPAEGETPASGPGPSAGAGTPSSAPGQTAPEPEVSPQVTAFIEAFGAARALMTAGQHAAAAEAFFALYGDPGLDLRPDLREGVVMNLAECRHVLGQFDAAISLYTELLDSPSQTFDLEGQGQVNRAVFLERLREARLGRPPTPLGELVERAKAPAAPA